MLKSQKQVNKQSKSLLAKCMATENIRVEHRSDAETAYFDTVNRVLVLPVWKDMSEALYDMLVGHEVSHALNTPANEWKKVIDAFKGNKGAFKQVVNVVEDARIERLIKESYPGIRRDFAKGYQQLHDRDLFELDGVNASDMNLIDRLNLEFKLGLFGHIQVPFSNEEKTFVTRMANTETFEDVIELSKELYQDWEDQQPEPQESESGEGSGEEGEEGESQGSNGDSNDDNGESQDGSQSGSESDDDSDTSESTDGAGDDAETQNGEDSGQSQDDDTDDGESADSQDGELGSESGGLDYDDYSNEVGNPSETQKSFDGALKDLVDDSSDAKSFQYFSLPKKMNLDNAIVDYKIVQDMFDEHNNYLTSHQDGDYNQRAIERLNKEHQECTQFLSRSKSVVQHMVQQFQMKQAADADRRTDISKTGVLDTTNMINYRWSEDIFLKNETHSDGKNHGMVFFVDWSGSMNSILQDTVEQMMILTEFCRKSGIPFEVYAFSSNAFQTYGEPDEKGRKTHLDLDFYESPENASTVLKPHDFVLINFLSSRMSKVEYTQACKNLYTCSKQHYGGTPREFSTGCTPLNEAVISALDIVPAFQEATGVQIVNTVFLTDGDGHSMGAYSRGYYGGSAVIHDPVTRRDYEVDSRGYHGETNAYLRVLKDRTNCNIVGIRLHSGKNVKNLRYSYLSEKSMGEASTMYRKNNYCIADADMTAYDELFIVRGNLDATTDIFEEIGDDVSYAKLRNAFKKGANSTKTCRIIATKMIDIFANRG